MVIYRLIFLEILHRKGGFAMGVLSAAVAVACLVGSLTLLRKHDVRTEQIVADKQRAAADLMNRMQEDFRRLTFKVGFTTLILHEKQPLAELFAGGHATHYMPEDYGETLAAAKVATINRVLPTLQERTAWPERGDEIGILRAIGVRRMQVLAIFLGEALVMGLAGGCTGYIAGLAVAAAWRDPAGAVSAQSLFDPVLLLASLLAAPLLALIASALPALLAARHDPADMLRE